MDLSNNGILLVGTSFTGVRERILLEATAQVNLQDKENNQNYEGNAFKPNDSQFLLLIPTFIYNIICCLALQMEGFLPRAVTFGSRDENYSQKNKPIHQDPCTSALQTHLHTLSDSFRQEDSQRTTKVLLLIREEMHDMKREWLEGIDEMDTSEQFEYACTMYSHLLSISGQLPNASFEQILQSEDMNDVVGMLVGLQRTPSRYYFNGTDILTSALALAFLDNGIVLPENPLVTQTVLQSFNLHHNKKFDGPIYAFPKKGGDEYSYKKITPTTVEAQSVDQTVVSHQGIGTMERKRKSESGPGKEIPSHMANAQLDSELTLWKEKQSSCTHPKEHVLGHVTKVPKTMEKLVSDKTHPAAKPTTLPQFSAQVPNAVQSSHSEDSLWSWRERISPFSYSAMCFYIKTESVFTLSQQDTRYGENICHACIHCFSSKELETLLQLVNGRNLGGALCVTADKWGDLPLHAAVKKCEVEAVEVLVGISPQAIKTANLSNLTPLQLAFNMQYTRCLRSLLHMLIKQDDKYRVCTHVLQPMLFLAMRNGYFHYLELVLTLRLNHSLKIDFNCTDDEQHTAWFHLLQHPQEVVQEAINLMVNFDLCIDSLAVDCSGTSLKSQLPVPSLSCDSDSHVTSSNTLEVWESYDEKNMSLSKQCPLSGINGPPIQPLGAGSSSSDSEKEMKKVRLTDKQKAQRQRAEQRVVETRKSSSEGESTADSDVNIDQDLPELVAGDEGDQQTMTSEDTALQEESLKCVQQQMVPSKVLAKKQAVYIDLGECKGHVNFSSSTVSTTASSEVSTGFSCLDLDTQGLTDGHTTCEEMSMGEESKASRQCPKASDISTSSTFDDPLNTPSFCCRTTHVAEQQPQQEQKLEDSHNECLSVSEESDVNIMSDVFCTQPTSYLTALGSFPSSFPTQVDASETGDQVLQPQEQLQRPHLSMTAHSKPLVGDKPHNPDVVEELCNRMHSTHLELSLQSCVTTAQPPRSACVLNHELSMPSESLTPPNTPDLIEHSTSLTTDTADSQMAHPDPANNETSFVVNIPSTHDHAPSLHCQSGCQEPTMSLFPVDLLTKKGPQVEITVPSDSTQTGDQQDLQLQPTRAKLPMTVKWPPHARSVKWPPHARSVKWPPHARSVKWSPHARSVKWPPHARSVKWLPHTRCPPQTKLRYLPHTKSRKCLLHARSVKWPPRTKLRICSPHTKSRKSLLHTMLKKCSPHTKSRKWPPHTKLKRCSPHTQSKKWPPHTRLKKCSPHTKSRKWLPHTKLKKGSSHTKSRKWPPQTKLKKCSPHTKSRKRPPHTKLKKGPSHTKSRKWPPHTKLKKGSSHTKSRKRPPHTKLKKGSSHTKSRKWPPHTKLKKGSSHTKSRKWPPQTKLKKGSPHTKSRKWLPSSTCTQDVDEHSSLHQVINSPTCQGRSHLSLLWRTIHRPNPYAVSQCSTAVLCGTIHTLQGFAPFTTAVAMKNALQYSYQNLVLFDYEFLSELLNSTLTSFIRSMGYVALQPALPSYLWSLFGFWKPCSITSSMCEPLRMLIHTARSNKHALPHAVRKNLNVLVELMNDIFICRESTDISAIMRGRGKGKGQQEASGGGKQTRQQDGTKERGKGQDEGQGRDAGRGGASKQSLKSKATQFLKKRGQHEETSVPKKLKHRRKLAQSQTTPSDSGFGSHFSVAEEPTDDDNDGHDEEYFSRVSEESENEEAQEEHTTSLQQRNSSSDKNLLGCMSFANSNHPLEIFRSHFTTYSKCCPRHDIQDIVVIATTCPASEALGPKRRYSSIKDLRKEDRHSQLNFESSLSREGKSGPVQLLPQQHQPVVADSPVNATRHKKIGPTAAVTTETATGTAPEAIPRATLPTEPAPSPFDRLLSGQPLGLSHKPSHPHHQWPQGARNSGNLASENHISNATDSHRPSLQTLSSVHPPAPHTSSPAFRSAHQHPLSVAEQREHKDRIRTAAELLHAQDYPRIFSLAYEGRPPPNLPPETRIAYVFITGLAYYKLSNNKESLNYFQQCLRLAQECGREGDVTLSCIYIGDIEFAQRNYLEAAKQYQRALHRYSRDTVARDFRMILPTQSALCAKRGSALRNASNVVEAIAAYEEAIARAESKKDKLSAHTSLGNLLQSVGENGRAVTEYEHSIQLATELQDFVSLGWAHGNMGNAYLGLYQRDKALHHLEKSLDLTVDHEPTPQAIGRAYNNLGTAYQSLGELEKAEEYYDLSLSQAIYGNDIPGQARVYGNIGNLLMIKKECDRAVPHYTEVLRLSQDKSTVSTARHNRGCAYYEWAESKKKNFLQRGTPSTAPTATKPLLHGPQFEDCEPEYRPPFIPKSIEKYYVQGAKDLDFVIKHHEESLHSIKGSPKGLSLSVSLFETNSRTFHRKQDCLVNMGKFEEALVTGEQSRARTHVNMSKFEEALLTAEQSRARTLGELLLKRRGPQLEHQLTSPPSLEQLKSVVGRQDCPVVYLSYTGARLLGWVFYPSPSQPSLNMFEVPLSDSEFDGKSFDYHLRYSLNEVLVEKSFEMYKPFKYDQDQNDPVLKLYDLVAQPVMTMFKKLKKDTESHGQPPKKPQKIIIIPDSYTNLLPMTCLLDRDEGKFWGDDHYFQIMPSLLTMGILDQLPSVSVSVPVEHQQMLCVVGNPTIPMFTYNGEEWNLGKLPHATKEAEWVSHILNCTPILHEQATKSAVMMRLMNAKVIHLATHGSAAAGFLAFSGMSSSFNETVDAKQVLIYPEEIERLSITPALVVLSSCDSGRGVVKADGIQGMARAFILAGAQAVLTTLWRVPDESACIFMQFFYQFLMDGLKGTEALHKAILSVRCFSKYSQYIHWSGYQLTGREIQFSFNRSSSATELTARLGNHSIFPQLEIVKQLETAFLNNPRLPTDVQVLRGSPGVKPSEALKDFIHLHHQHFRGGIYWISCRSPQLVEASVDYITKMMELKDDLSNMPDTNTQSTLIVFDFSDKVPLQDSPLLDLLKKPNVHIVIISKHYPPPDSLQKEIDRKLLRGTRVIDIQPLSTIHTTQRIVHSVLKDHHLASSNEQQDTFEDLAEFTTGSPAIIDVVSSLLDSHLEQATDTSTEEALLRFADVVKLGELTKPQSVVRNRQQRSPQPPTSSKVREISRSVYDSISTVQESEDIWTTNSHYDSWQVITVLIEQCQLSPEERLLLFCLSNLGCSPIPSILVTEMATMITKASHQSHLASSLHTKLEKMNLLKPYPKPVIYHPSPAQHSPLYTDFVYVPQFIAEAIWKDMMSDMDKVMALGTVYKTFKNVLKQSPSPIEHSFLVGLCSLLVDSYELHYELVGKECFQEVYRLFLSLRARTPTSFDDFH